MSRFLLIFTRYIGVRVFLVSRFFFAINHTLVAIAYSRFLYPIERTEYCVHKYLTYTVTYL